MPDADNRESGAPAHRLVPAAPEEEHVFGACDPGWHSAAGQREALADWTAVMRANDIERVVCLLSGGQPIECRDMEGYAEIFGPDTVLHAPIPDAKLASPALLDREILPFLDSAAEADERVVVHGLDGLGRTGQVLAVWLAHDRGYDPECALDTVAEMGRAPRNPVESGHATESELRDLLAIFA